MPYLTHTNDVVGVYVTASARVHLYKFLDRLQENAIYCDTDFVIYIQPSGEPWPIATWDKLGDMYFELKPSDLIIEFASSGPKIMHTGCPPMKGRKLYAKEGVSL